MFDDRLIGGSVTGAQASKVVVEDNVEHPTETILDPPVTPHHPREGFGVELA